ncbi:MAG: MmcQ/YjbR family DNA-binding protein [Flavobacteriaceae bacterium]|nr:MmcQ/YjbR family DNA-binding protein [Flavobacteriaceae bacterium]
MNIEEYREYCIVKKAVTEGFPFDQTTLVFKVAGKMFAITSLNQPFRISLKCDPDRAIELREQYPCIIPGYHLNKKLWNTITVDGTLSDDFLKELIDHSYELIVASLPKSKRP